MKKPKKLTVITIRSNEMDEEHIQAIRKQFKKQLPKNHKFALICVDSDSAVTVDTVIL